MKGAYVPARRTPVTPSMLREALRAQLVARGVQASEHALTGLVAMSAHETGRWASCWNYNLGNVKAGETWEGMYTCLDNVWEILGGVKRWFSPRGETVGKGGPLKGAEHPFPPGHPQTRFRAYASLADGVDGWVNKMLTTYRRSTAVLLSGGSTDAFLASLKSHRYFTGDLVAYQKSVRSYYREFSARPSYDLLKIAGVQLALTALGYAPGPADGDIGPRTRAAVVAFQEDAGLEPDGVVGPITRNALRAALDKL